MIEYDKGEETRILEAAVRDFPMGWYGQQEWRMLAQGAGDLAFLALGAAITLTTSSLWICVPIWILMGGRIHALGVLMHDLSHVRHLESQPLKRVLIDAVVCYPIMMNMDYYGYAHALHHQWSNVPGKDPYFFPLNRMSPPAFLGFVVFSTFFLPAWLTLRLALFPLTILSRSLRNWHVKYFSQFGAAADLEDPHRLEQGKKLWIWALGPSVFWYAVLIALWKTGAWAAFGWAYGIPLVLSALIGQVRLACDHVYEDATGNSVVEQLGGSTNIEAPWWQALVLAPHAACYHGMHHVVPNVPNWHWRDAHERFKASGSKVYASTVYRGYGSIMWKLLKDQIAWARAQYEAAAAAARSGPFAGAPEPGFRELPLVSLEDAGAPRREAALLRVPPVEEINAQSKAHEFGIGDLDWKPCSRDRLYAPECMSHLYFTEAYKLLNPEEQLSYNQIFAEGISEQFVFLEQVLLVRGLKSFLRLSGGKLPPALVEACEFFIQEEDKHSAMFRRLLVEANPATYEKETFHVYKLSDSQAAFLDRSMADPTLYIWWIWVATLFEEKTIDFHRKYQAERERLEPMYVTVHRFHCLDEVRHLQMDHHFVDALWAPAPAWKKAMNVYLFKKIMWSFVHPKRTVTAAVRELVRKHPRLEPMTDRLVEAGMGVADNRAWHEATYSRRSLPNTYALFDRFPEMHGISSVLPLYHPRAIRPDAPRAEFVQ
ncbi:MAG: fatty acid desaturase [Candidatus Wallbacteria bacterium]|nr:fatty acid desaturase [Candidatus Wallbacteria bacterium]